MLATKMILEKEFRNRMEHSFILGISFGLDKGREEGIVKGIELGKLYNVPINVDTIKEGYPILCT